MNLPTKITIARIALIPIFILMYCLKDVFAYYYLPMTALFILASCTDFVDGHIARKHNLVTDLGKFLDPIADKILVLSGLVVLLMMKDSTGVAVLPKYFGEIAVIIIMAREFIIGVLRQMAASKGCVLAADNWGKWKTVITLIAQPMLMLVPIITESIVFVHWLGVVFKYLGWTLFAIATLLTVISGINYVIKNKHVFSQIKDNNGEEGNEKG